LDSGGGGSELHRGGQNFFGIKPIPDASGSKNNKHDKKRRKDFSAASGGKPLKSSVQNTAEP